MRREVLLEEMELVVLLKALLEGIEPFYATAGSGRRPYSLEAMLRVHLMQNWFALSNPAIDEASTNSLRCKPFPGCSRPKAARPSTGRTALALKIAEHVGLRVGKPVEIFSMEMSAGQLGHRLVASGAGMNQKHLREPDRL